MLAQLRADAHEQHLGIFGTRAQNELGLGIRDVDAPEMLLDHREARVRLQVGRVLLGERAPVRCGGGQAPDHHQKIGARGAHVVVVRRERKILIVRGDRFVAAAEPRERPCQRAHGHRLHGIDRERAAIRADGFLVAFFGARDIAESDMPCGDPFGHFEQRAEMRLGLARPLVLQGQSAEHLASRVQVRLQAQRVLERALGKARRAALGERAGERELDHRIVRREVRGAPEVAQRGVEIVALEQQRTEPAERLRILGDAQRGAEMPLGDIALAAHHRELTQARVRRADVRIHLERALVMRARGLELAGLETQRAEAERDAGLRRRDFARARDEISRFGGVAALMAQQTEQMQRIGIVGLFGEMAPVASFRLVETAQAVQIDRFFQHVPMRWRDGDARCGCGISSNGGDRVGCIASRQRDLRIRAAIRAFDGISCAPAGSHRRNGEAHPEIMPECARRRRGKPVRHSSAGFGCAAYYRARHGNSERATWNVTGTAAASRAWSPTPSAPISSCSSFATAGGIATTTLQPEKTRSSR